MTAGAASTVRGAGRQSLPDAGDPQHAWLRFDMLGQRVALHCPSATARRRLWQCFEAMAAPHDGALDDVEWRIIPRPDAQGWTVEGSLGERFALDRNDDLLYGVEKSITLA